MDANTDSAAEERTAALDGALEYDEDFHALIYTERISPDEYGASAIVARSVPPLFGQAIVAEHAAHLADDRVREERIAALEGALGEAEQDRNDLMALVASVDKARFAAGNITPSEWGALVTQTGIIRLRVVRALDALEGGPR